MGLAFLPLCLTGAVGDGGDDGRQKNRTTRFIALFRACLIEYEFMGATQTSQTMKQFTLKGFALMSFCFEHADARALGTVSSSRKIYSRKT
jgi:hypothetical protein